MYVKHLECETEQPYQQVSIFMPHGIPDWHFVSILFCASSVARISGEVGLCCGEAVLLVPGMCELDPFTS